MAVRINGAVVQEQRFYRAYVQMAGGRSPAEVAGQAPAEHERMRRAAEAQVLRDVLLGQWAETQGIRVSAAEVTAAGKLRHDSVTPCGGAVQDACERMLLARAEAQITRHVRRPGKAEVERAYHERPGAFRQEEAVLVAQFVCLGEGAEERSTAREKMARAEAALAAGEGFAPVAARFSDCAAGQLGWVARGEMVAVFEDVVFGLAPGATSEVFETVFGFHLARLERRRAGGVRELAEVRAELARAMHESRRQQALAAVLDGLRRAAVIEEVDGPELGVVDGERLR